MQSLPSHLEEASAAPTCDAVVNFDWTKVPWSLPSHRLALNKMPDPAIVRERELEGKQTAAGVISLQEWMQQMAMGPPCATSSSSPLDLGPSPADNSKLDGAPEYEGQDDGQQAVRDPVDSQQIRVPSVALSAAHHDPARSHSQHNVAEEPALGAVLSTVPADQALDGQVKHVQQKTPNDGNTQFLDNSSMQEALTSGGTGDDFLFPKHLATFCHFEADESQRDSAELHGCDPASHGHLTCLLYSQPVI